MAKTLLYRLLGVGKTPVSFKATLAAEDLLVFDEGIKSSVTYRDFRAPGKYFGWKRQGFSGCLALTKVRLVALMYGNPAINVPLTDERLQRMKFAVEGSDTFVVTFDPSLFHTDWSGTVEYRFHTDSAQQLIEQLRASSHYRER